MGMHRWLCRAPPAHSSAVAVLHYEELRNHNTYSHRRTSDTHLKREHCCNLGLNIINERGWSVISNRACRRSIRAIV